jgi:choline transport protein
MDIPLNAIIVVIVLSLLVDCLGFGSSVATNAVISLSNAGLLISYIGSLSMVMLMRIRGQPLLPRRWSLGRWGMPVNLLAMAFLLISFVMSFFPSYVDPTPADMNWAIVLFAFVLFAAILDYFVRAHKVYRPPVEIVRKIE